MLLKIFIVTLFLLILIFWLYIRAMRKLIDLKFRKLSLSSRYGRITEQFMPFMKDFPYDVHNFRFIGNPIDGIQFEENKIIIMEFKSASAPLTPKQKRIRELVKRKQVEFEEVRVG